MPYSTSELDTLNFGHFIKKFHGGNTMSNPYSATSSWNFSEMMGGENVLMKNKKWIFIAVVFTVITVYMYSFSSSSDEDSSDVKTSSTKTASSPAVSTSTTKTASSPAVSTSTTKTASSPAVSTSTTSSSSSSKPTAASKKKKYESFGQYF